MGEFLRQSLLWRGETSLSLPRFGLSVLFFLFVTGSGESGSESGFEDSERVFLFASDLSGDFLRDEKLPRCPLLSVTKTGNHLQSISKETFPFISKRQYVITKTYEYLKSSQLTELMRPKIQPML